jgi:hypothetical protein
MKGVESPDSGPALPLTIGGNDGRDAAWARLVSGALFLGLLIAVPTLVAAEWFAGPPEPWRVSACVRFATLGGVFAFMIGVFRIALRPQWWTITDDAIVQDGPGRRRRALRWDEVRRVGRNARGVWLKGPRGSAIVVDLHQLPTPKRIVARAAIEERLGLYFDFPKPPVLTREQKRQALTATLLIGLPGLAGLIVPVRLVNRRHPLLLAWLRRATEVGWFREWMRHDPKGALGLFAFGLMAPAILWMLIMCRVLRPCLPPRPAPILPRERPQAARGGGGQP